jgi:hypothetical protein
LKISTEAKQKSNGIKKRKRKHENMKIPKTRKQRKHENTVNTKTQKIIEVQLSLPTGGYIKRGQN